MREFEFKEGWVSVALLIMMLLCVAWSIQSARWTEGLAMLQAVVVLGGLLGIVLAKSRTPSRLAHLLSALVGFTWSVYLTSRALSSATGLPLERAVVELERRVQSWIWVLFGGGTSAGNFVFLLLLALLMWLVAYFCAWAVFRWQHTWSAVIIGGVALMINVTYAPNNLTGFLVAYVLFSLLLVVRTSLAHYEQEWRSARVGYSPELVYGFLRSGLVITILTIGLAWVAPQALASQPMRDVWDRVGEPWNKLQEQSSRVFQDLNYRNEPAFITFSRSMKFGGAVELTDKPIMDVESKAGRYWRIIVFHDYTSDGWTNTDTDTILIRADERGLATPDYKQRQEITQTYTIYQDLGPQRTIAGAGQPIRASIPIRAVVSLVTGQDEEEPESKSSLLAALPGDPSVVYAQQPLQGGDSYQIISSLTTSNEESLRSAGTEYPAWVAPRYLQIPETLPERVTLLAEQITTGREAPYDKAKAIERYLRDIPYNERIDAPAPGQDGVDYFLFDVRQGYCDYYSSAMVVMLRSVGVPARYVRGYSQGQKEEDAFIVLERNGHAWPEVFFPEYGWVEFEPTAGEPILARPSTEDDQALIDGRTRDRAELPFDEQFEDMWDQGIIGQIPAATPEPIWQRAGRLAGLALSVAAFFLALSALLMARRRRRVEGLSVAERVYLDLVEWVRRLLKLAPLAHQTPHEYAGTVSTVMPKGRQAVERIADLYVEERFGAKAVANDQAETAWSQTRLLLWRRWITSRGERLRNIWTKLFPATPPKPAWQEKDQKDET